MLKQNGPPRWAGRSVCGRAKSVTSSLHAVQDAQREQDVQPVRGATPVRGAMLVQGAMPVADAPPAASGLAAVEPPDAPETGVVHEAAPLASRCVLLVQRHPPAALHLPHPLGARHRSWRGTPLA